MTSGLENLTEKEISEYAKKANDFIANELPVRRVECEKDGHKDIAWHGYVVDGMSNPLNDRVSGMCLYCLTPMKRSLNPEERESIRDMYKSMKIPMDF